jgi:hypothetical protein
MYKFVRLERKIDEAVVPKALLSGGLVRLASNAYVGTGSLMLEFQHFALSQLGVTSTQQQTSRPVVLLDLNKTLAEKCRWSFQGSACTYYPNEDVYSLDLIRFFKTCSPHLLHLVTARTMEYRDATRARVHETDPDFKIHSLVFKSGNFTYKPVHEFKEFYARSLIRAGVPINLLFGLESNSVTRSRYQSLGVTTCDRNTFLKNPQIFGLL